MPAVLSSPTRGLHRDLFDVQTRRGPIWEVVGGMPTHRHRKLWVVGLILSEESNWGIWLAWMLWSTIVLEHDPLAAV